MKLSIALPTKNNYISFRQTLVSVLSEIKGKDVEVSIVDDSDGTENDNFILEEVWKANAKYNFLHRPEGHRGFDSAIEALVGHSSGEYIWFLGDEIVIPGSIDYILNILESGPNMVWVNSVSDKGVPSFQNGSIDWLEGKYEDLKKLNGGVLLGKVGDLLGYVSSIIVKKSAFEGYLNSDKTFKGTWIDFLHPLLKVMSLDNNYLVGRPCFVNRTKKPTDKLGYDPFRVWGVDYPKILKSVPYFEVSLERRQSLKKTFNQVWKPVIVYRALGIDYNYGSKTPKILELIKNWWTFPQTYLAVLLMMIPRFLIKPIYKYAH